MGLTGYVRNLPGGGAVEVWAEGPRDRLERLIELLHEGPRMAIVEDVGVEWVEYQGHHALFDVKF
jgi:acylphosphatase